MFHRLDCGTVTVQPAGPAGKRHVFITLVLSGNQNARQIEFVLSEQAASRLGDALISGSVGVMRELNLADGLD
jgi:hypothetical protein